MKSNLIAHPLREVALNDAVAPPRRGLRCPLHPNTTDLASLDTPPTGPTPAIDQSLRGWQRGGERAAPSRWFLAGFRKPNSREGAWRTLFLQQPGQILWGFSRVRTEGTMGMVGTRLWARARAWESMPLASSKPRTSLRHNNLQPSTGEQPEQSRWRAWALRAPARSCPADQPKEIGSAESTRWQRGLGRGLELLGWLQNKAVGKAGVERRQAAHAADGR